MVQFECCGFIQFLYMFVGCIFIVLGYWLFVDMMFIIVLLAAINVDQVCKCLLLDKMLFELVEEVFEVLLDLILMVGVVMVLKKNCFSLCQVEFLLFEGNWVLVILVLNDCEVQNCIIIIDCCYSESELVQVANYLNYNFFGSDLELICSKLFSDMKSDKI